MHVEVKSPLERIMNTFVQQTSYSWDEATSKLNISMKEPASNEQNYKQSSIAFTTQRGLVVFGDELYQSVPVVTVSQFTSMDQSRQHPISAANSAFCTRDKPIFSVDCPNEGEKRHALVQVSTKRFIHDLASIKRQQMNCNL